MFFVHFFSIILLTEVKVFFIDMVTNITVSKCFPDKSIYVSWKIPSHMNFENLTGMTYIALDGDTHEDIHELKMVTEYQFS